MLLPALFFFSIEHSRKLPCTVPERQLIQAPCDGKPAETANGVHVAFYAATTDEVDAFYRAALAAGAKDEGAPGKRPHYGEQYYGCFVRDLDGHKIEAMAWLEPAQG